MRAKTLVGGMTLAFALTLTRPADAQVFGGNEWYQPSGYGYGGGYGGYGGGYGYGGGTAAGNYLQGMSQVIRSEGQYNLLTSQAGVNNEEARSRYLDNHKKWTENYFQGKEAYQARQTQKWETGKHSAESLNLAAKSAVPRMLGSNALDSVTGHIAWPEALLGKEFEAPRLQLQQLFELRSKTSPSLGFSQKVRNATEVMVRVLRSHIEEMPANEYIAARKFLDGLDFAARANAM